MFPGCQGSIARNQIEASLSNYFLQYDALNWDVDGKNPAEGFSGNWNWVSSKIKKSYQVQTLKISKSDSFL